MEKNSCYAESLTIKEIWFYLILTTEI